MSRLKLLPYQDLARVAEVAGFEWVRCRGSHNTFRSPDGQVVVIPDLRKIIRDMGLTVDEYNRLVDSL
ncbi:MAG: type II toxin-antitoxin system HicA family toxin [Anaerolineae bacterium]